MVKMSATITSSSVSQQVEASTHSTTANKRRVCFAAPVFFEHPETTDDDELGPGELWLSRTDFQLILSKTLRKAREVQKHTMEVEGLNQALHRAYRKASLLSNQDELEEHLRHASEEGEEDRGLKLWCQHHHSRRGLEKHASRLCAASRKSLTRKAWKQVISLSEQGADPETIRLAYQSISRPAVIFATMMAVSDSVAAQSVAGDNNV